MKNHHSIPIMARLIVLLSITLPGGCGGRPITPVDLYPEDLCAQCRMVISERIFAAEIITQDGEVFKFDDIGCMIEHRRKSNGKEGSAIFVVDYESREWIEFSKSTIIATSVKSPMGSGMIAFGDSQRATKFIALHPTSTQD